MKSRYATYDNPPKTVTRAKIQSEADRTGESFEDVARAMMAFAGYMGWVKTRREIEKILYG